MIHIPYLLQQRFVWINVFSNLFLESSDNKGISHSQTQGLMGSHLIGHIFCFIVENESSSSRVMLSEGCDIKDIVVIDD